MFIDQFSFIIRPDSQYSSVVFYVEDTYYSEINQFIRNNFDKVTEYYVNRKIEFCYLPFLLNNKDSQNVIFYNRPYIKPEFNDQFIRDIYQRIIHQLYRPFRGPGLVMFNSNESFGYPIDEEYFNSSNTDFYLFDPFRQFEKIANQIADQLFFEKSIDEARRYENLKINPKSNIWNDENELVIEETKVYDNHSSEVNIENIPYSDDKFEVEAFQLANEVRDRMLKLKETNSLYLLGDMLEKMLRIPQKLSRIVITRDYQIFLQDYNMKEVFMQPLAKSLYILFLNHPEGILFKKLSDYYNELLIIYRDIYIHENEDRARESIRALTDPTNNSVNVKCALIRAAFLEVIADNLAQNYYVTGKRGKAKKITLDRRLVLFR